MNLQKTYKNKFNTNYKYEYLKNHISQRLI